MVRFQSDRAPNQLGGPLLNCVLDKDPIVEVTLFAISRPGLASGSTLAAPQVVPQVSERQPRFLPSLRSLQFRCFDIADLSGLRDLRPIVEARSSAGMAIATRDVGTRRIFVAAPPAVLSIQTDPAKRS